MAHPSRELRKVVENELDKLGVVEYEFGKSNGSHQFVKFMGKKMFFPFSTSNLWRVGKEVRSQLRRMVAGRDRRQFNNHTQEKA